MSNFEATQIKNADGDLVDGNHPVQISLDSIYADDIDVVNSSNGTFSGAVTDYFDSLKTVSNDASATNPKTIKVWFKRTIQTHAIAFGCDDISKSFSNIKVSVLGSAEEVRYTVDTSTDNTKRNSYAVPLPHLFLNGFIIEFHTADEVGLSNIYMSKTIDTHATLAAEKPDGSITEIGATAANNLKVSVEEQGGVPITYSKKTETGQTFPVSKGQLSKFRVRPQIANEHVESSRNVQGTVTSSNIVGQYFKASADNINSVCLTMESGGGVTPIDTFDAYANNAALQAAWVATSTLATLETTIVKSGESMRLDGGDAVGSTWTKTIASVDKTGGNVEFDIHQTKEYNKNKFEVFVGDGTNTKSLALSGVIKDAWVHIDAPLSAFVEDGGGTTNEAAITKIGYRLTDNDAGEFAYIDGLSLFSTAGAVALKLWDMGATLPTSGVDVLTGQYTTLGDIGAAATPAASVEFDLQGGKKLYKVQGFVAGTAKEIPTNALLTPGNYYALTLHYVDDDVLVYGPDETYSISYYTNGYAFTTPNEGTAPTQIGTYNDLMFIIFSTQDVYINEAEIKFDATPGSDASFSMFVEDSNTAITDIVTDGETLFGQTHEEDMSDRPAFMEKGGKVECYYNDAGTDSVNICRLAAAYYYIPPTING